jgi:NhaA family Na+:H+ antiporter
MGQGDAGRRQGARRVARHRRQGEGRHLSRPFDPFREFLRLESAAGILLFGAAVLAMIADNTALAPYYERLFETHLTVRFGKVGLDKSLLHWINDGLMAVFFLLVGLELKREVTTGELSTRTQVTVPLVAAFFGMLVPAAIYVALNYADAVALRGWAIPSATDIAFSLGVLALLGGRVPVFLKVRLTAIAVFDDLGAIVVIAAFYTDELSLFALLLACVPLAALIAMNMRGVKRIGPYIVAGIALWLCVLESGVHATLAGVATALAVPRETGGDIEPRLHPWVAFGILPLFAFANSGIRLAGVGIGELFAPVTLGIALGLFAGKQIGIFGSLWVIARLGWARLPEGATWWMIYGLSALTGIGFTMSLFIGTLAFTDLTRAVDVRLGVVLGSVASALLGYLVLRWFLPSRTSD